MCWRSEFRNLPAAERRGIPGGRPALPVRRDLVSEEAPDSLCSRCGRRQREIRELCEPCYDERLDNARGVDMEWELEWGAG